MKSKTYDEFNEFCNSLNKKFMEAFPKLHMHYDSGEKISCVTIMLDGGIGSVRITWYDNDEIALISDLSVVPHERKKQFGSILLLAVLHVAKFFEFKMLQLKVLKGTWMEDWYRRSAGFFFTQSDDDGKYDWMISIIGNLKELL